jgi:hypothetical protein
MSLMNIFTFPVKFTSADCLPRFDELNIGHGRSIIQMCKKGHLHVIEKELKRKDNVILTDADADDSESISTMIC